MAKIIQLILNVTMHFKRGQLTLKSILISVALVLLMLGLGKFFDIDSIEQAIDLAGDTAEIIQDIE